MFSLKIELTYKTKYSLWSQCLNVTDFSGESHCETINHVEMFFPKQEEPFTGVQPLYSSTSIHMLNLKQT